MKPVARLSPVVFSLSVALSLSCVPDRASGPRLAPSFDRSTAPGLDVACRDKPGNHLARRPNAPVELLCALTLPAGSQPIQNITKSWVDGGRLYATELKNASVYIWDVVSHDYVGRMTGFVGATGNAATSGPNSIVLSGDGHAWVSDGISAVRVVDLSSMSIVATISTAIPACGTTCQRTNEITFDPDHRIVFVQNPSPLSGGAAIDTYGTFISADPPYTVLGTITFPDRRGQEAPLWDPDQHRIVTAVSGRLVGTMVFQQYVAVIDPTVRPFTVEKKYDIDCFALGLAATPGAVFGINDPALGPVEHLVIPGCGRALIIDLLTVTGDIKVMPVGGGNETWYNPGDGNFYVTGADFSVTPAGPNSLGVIDARSSTVLQYVTALGATNPAAAAENNLIYAAVPANATTATACTRFGAAVQASGCILVFAHVPGSD